MTEPPGASIPRGLMLLIRMTSLACCVSLLNCDQFRTIAVVDSSVNSDSPATVPPDVPVDAGIDVYTPPNPPPIGGNGDSDVPDASADANLDLDTSLNPPIDGNDDPDVGTDCVDRPIIAGDCDPTKEDNECLTAASMKCFIDFQKAIPTGYCAFWTPPIPGPCLTFAGMTDSCFPGQYCYDQICRKLCLCDADCAAGECCTEPIGGGFKLCSGC